jgi:carbonic anhydrase/acetyltransferase-like protein (isoleucine patch superfamily)
MCTTGRHAAGTTAKEQTMTQILAVADRVPAIASNAFLADDVTVAGDVRLDEEVSVWFGSVLRADYAHIEVGAQTNIQDLTVVHTDENQPTIIGSRVTVGHRALLHGCRIDDDVLVGMGAIVMNGAHVGAGAVVAAGALVTEGTVVPAGMLAIGVPAKVIARELPPVPRKNVASYLRLAEQYRDARTISR